MRRNKGRRVVWRRQTLHCMTHYSIPPPLFRSNAVVRSLALGDTDMGELKYKKKMRLQEIQRSIYIGFYCSYNCTLELI